MVREEEDLFFGTIFNLTRMKNHKIFVFDTTINVLRRVGQVRQATETPVACKVDSGAANTTTQTVAVRHEGEPHAAQSTSGWCSKDF